MAQEIQVNTTCLTFTNSKLNLGTKLICKNASPWTSAVFHNHTATYACKIRMLIYSVVSLRMTSDHTITVFTGASRCPTNICC